MFDVGRVADSRRELAQRQDPAHPFGRAHRAQFFEDRQVGHVGSGIEAIALFGQAVAQHGRERALPDQKRIDLLMRDLEMPGDLMAAIPDQAARPHHGVQRVHADEQALDLEAGFVEAAAEAVDHVLERHVA